MLRNIFINPEEHRLRAPWRLLIQALIYFGGSLIAQILIGIGAAVVLLLSGGNIQDQEALMSLAYNPIVHALTGLASLVFIFVSYFVAARWIDRRPFKAYGFHFNSLWWADFVFGLFLGAVLMLFIFGVELSAGWIKITGYLQSTDVNINFWLGIVGYLVAFLCVGIYEEMLSRGYQIRNLAEGLNFKFLNPRAALLLAYFGTSIFFGWLHYGNPNATLTSTGLLVVAGLFLGFGYILTGELALPIALHITWNFFQGNVFGFPVSGLHLFASFIQIEQGGPELWTGGEFGPEAGLIGLTAILLGFLLIAVWVRVTRGTLHLNEQLAMYQPPQGKETTLPIQDNTAAIQQQSTDL